MMHTTESKTFKKSSEYKKTKFVFYLFVFLLLLFIYQTLPWYLFYTDLDSENNDNQKVNELSFLQGSEPDYPISESDLEEKPGKYIDTDLRFSFLYPESEVVQSCSGDQKCLYLPYRSIRVEFLKLDFSDASTIKDALFNIDLFCSFETQYVKVACNNERIEEYTNPIGVLSYVLYRSKHIKETIIEDGTITSGTYYEKLFMVPIRDESFGFALISTDDPRSENQDSLLKLVDTFKLI